MGLLADFMADVTNSWVIDRLGTEDCGDVLRLADMMGETDGHWSLSNMPADKINEQLSDEHAEFWGVRNRFGRELCGLVYFRYVGSGQWILCNKYVMPKVSDEATIKELYIAAVSSVARRLGTTIVVKDRDSSILLQSVLSEYRYNLACGDGGAGVYTRRFR